MSGLPYRCVVTQVSLATSVPAESASMKRIFLRILIGITLCALAGCQTAKPKDYKTMWSRFFLEATAGDGTPLTLPQSNVHVTVNSKPVVTEGDILNVELVQVDLGKALMFQLTGSASRDFYRLSGTNQGRRLVLVVNDLPLGARRIDGAIANGVIYVFPEVPEAEMAELVTNLKKSALALQQEIAKKA